MLFMVMLQLSLFLLNLHMVCSEEMSQYRLVFSLTPTSGFLKVVRLTI